jgi:hypothetical protein
MLLSETQKLILDSTRDWITKFVKPKIEESFNSSIPLDLVSGLSELGAFGFIFPEKLQFDGKKVRTVFGKILRSLDIKL